MPDLDLRNKAVLKIALGVLLAGGMLGAFFFTHVPFGYQQKRDKVNALKGEYEKKSTELARARASVADLPRFEAEYEQLHDRWIQAAELLPADRQYAALLRKVTLAGEQTGVTFVLFRPDAPRPETYYTELPVDISVSGGYHQVGAFLAELSNMRRIITVGNLKVVSNTKTDDNGATSATLRASAYSLNTSPVPAPAVAPAKKGASDEHKDS
jgi:type IV pilus assembly protein PilO